MANKAKNSKSKNTVSDLSENMLPQNILSVGEHVEENKNIYISQNVYKEIRKFAQNKTVNESGGMLVGTVIEAFGKTNIIISGFVQAKHCEATPTTLTFTHSTWEYVHSQIEKKHEGKKIVGWIHTHPNFGIFLSEYDKFIHQNFFNEDYQIAYVVDPIQNIEGFYFWINGNLERCKGFYVFDKTGAKITVGGEKNSEIAKRTFDIKSVLIGMLAAAIALLIFSNISTNNRLTQLEKQQQALQTSANQALGYMQQVVITQSAQIQQLTDALTEAGIAVDIASPSADSNSAVEAEDTVQDIEPNSLPAERVIP